MEPGYGGAGSVVPNDVTVWVSGRVLVDVCVPRASQMGHARMQ